MDINQNHTVKIDKVLAVISLSIVFMSVVALSIYSKESIDFAEKVLYWSTTVFSTPVLLFTVFAFVFVIGLAFSKYGNIKLGEGKPDYKTSSWIFMFMMSGLGSSLLYWGFLDWAYYYQTPGLNIQPGTPEALTYSVPYTMFHYSVSAWSIYALASISVCYSFHVRKNKSLSLASMIESITGFKETGIVGRIVDLMFLLCMFGALTISLVLTALTFTTILSSLTGIPNTFLTNAIFVLGASVLFAISSYIGMDKGMQRLSSMVCYALLAFIAYIFFVGPSKFILDNTISSIGHMFTNFVSMSLFTDPLGDGKFTREWTAFYWLWWISYAPGVALFVTRVSKGRTIKEVILAMVLGGAVGMLVLFGIMESYSVHQFINGAIDVPGILGSQGGEVAIVQLLGLLPGGTLMMWFLLFIMVIFLAAHMDAVGYAVSVTCSKGLKQGRDPSPQTRLFWCVMLALLPLAMIFSKAPLDTMKMATIVTAIPFIVIILIQTFGLIRWLREDYAALPSHLIEQGEMSDFLKTIQEKNLIQENEENMINQPSYLIDKKEICNSSNIIQENQKVITGKI
jgi:BCCT family betaine/carnitine transporter